jgi:hypothetical protein
LNFFKKYLIPDLSGMRVISTETGPIMGMEFHSHTLLLSPFFKNCVLCNDISTISLQFIKYPRRDKYNDTVGFTLCAICVSFYRCYRPDIDEIQNIIEKKRQASIKSIICAISIHPLSNIVMDYLDDDENNYIDDKNVLYPRLDRPLYPRLNLPLNLPLYQRIKQKPQTKTTMIDKVV